MKRILTVLLASTLFTGCCIFTGNGGFCKDSISSTVCGGTVDGYTATIVAYGDSELVVVPISHIRPNTEWRFRLQPIIRRDDYNDYNAMTVDIKGKAPESGQEPDHNDWISIGGSYDTSDERTRTITLCTPSDLPPESTYKYEVEVEETGKLDPRATVC